MEEYATNLLRLVRGEISLDLYPELIEVVPLLKEANRWKLRFALQDEFVRLFPLLEGPTSLEVDWLDYRVESVTGDLVWNLKEELTSFLRLHELGTTPNSGPHPLQPKHQW